MLERQLLWYKSSQSEPEIHSWNFLIINEKREIRIIKQNLYDNLKPIIEENIIGEGRIKPAGLCYELVCLKSPVPELKFCYIYQGRVREDRRLQPRMTRDGWNDLIGKIYRGEI